MHPGSTPHAASRARSARLGVTASPTTDAVPHVEQQSRLGLDALRFSHADKLRLVECWSHNVVGRVHGRPRRRGLEHVQPGAGPIVPHPRRERAQRCAAWPSAQRAHRPHGARVVKEGGARGLLGGQDGGSFAAAFSQQTLHALQLCGDVGLENGALCERGVNRGPPQRNLRLHVAAPSRRRRHRFGITVQVGALSGQPGRKLTGGIRGGLRLLLKSLPLLRRGRKAGLGGSYGIRGRGACDL